VAKPTGAVRQVLRRLLRAPRFTIVALLTLTAGIGANAAVFAVLHGVLLKPLPYPHPEELIGVWHNAPGVNIPNLEMSPSNYFVYREQSKTFQDIGVYQTDAAAVTGGGQAEQVDSLRVTDGVLPLLGVTPAAGRLFTPADDAPGGPPIALLSHAYALQKFGSAAAAVGRQLQIDNQSREIIGVLPRGFHFLDRADAAVVFPMRFNRTTTHLGQFGYQGVARLKPGVTVGQANEDVARMLPIVLRSFPAPDGISLRMFEGARMGPNVRPLKNDAVGDVGGVLTVLMGCIAIVLVIACANVANLWLVRLEGRRRELALRAALGAGRTRIAGELLLECLLLGATSGVAALAVAAASIRALVALAPAGIPRLREINIDATTALFTVGLALGASVLFGALPILKYAGARPNTGMRDAGRSLSQSREQHRMRGALVVAQVALALVLLVGSGLMIRTFHALTQVNPGFTDPARVQTVRFYIREPLAKDPDAVIRTEEAIRERLRAIPGVSAVAVSTGVPMDGESSNDPVFAQDRAYREGELAKLRRFRFVLPGYFSALGTPLIAGRDFTPAEMQQHTPIAIISRGFATEYWGRPDLALGKRIRVGATDDWREIVGVAGDTYDDGVSKEPVSMAYWPMIRAKFEGDALNAQRSATYALRTTRAGTDALMNEVRQAAWSIDSNMPLFWVHTLDDYYQRSMARTSFTLLLLGVAGSMALLLGVLGLYGVIAYSVSQRTREIGIRMALGAQPALLTNMFVRDGLRLAMLGVICGLGAAVLAVRLMSKLLFHVAATDPMTYVLVSVGLVMTALIATYVPSRRAASVDPAVALRAE
jgi:predicted permease